MHAPLPAALKPVKVLFLSRGESSVRTDVKSLRTLGTETFIHLADTDSALQRLASEQERLNALERLSGKRSLANPFDLVLCDELLADGPVRQFLLALAKSGRMSLQPVLVLASTAKMARTLREAGVPVLERPYSGADLERMAKTAMSPMRRTLKAEALEKAFAPKKQANAANPAAGAPGATGTNGATGTAVAPKKPATSAGWVALGIEELKAGNLAEAEQAFTQALERTYDNLEAALGMVRVRRAQKDDAGVRRYLLKAATSLKRAGNAERYAIIAEKLPEHMRENPFIHEGIALMNEGRFQHAARNFTEACAEAGNTPLHRIVSRACQQTPSPDECLRKLCQAYAQMGNQVTAKALQRRLLSYNPNWQPGEYTWLDAFPRLKEALSVMRYTTWVWRQV